MKTTLTLGTVFTVVALLSSYLFVPRDLKLVFFLVAVVGMIGGYEIGRLVCGLARRSKTRIFFLLAATLICATAAITYMFLIDMGSANVSDILIIAFTFFLFFFSFGFLIATARVRIGESM